MFQLGTKPVNKKLAIFVIVLAIIGFGVVTYNQKSGFDKFVNQKDSFVAKPNPPPAPKVEIVKLEANKIPDVFPRDIISEKDIQILQSYYTNPFSYNEEQTMYQVQSSFRFVSKKGLDENFISYNKYLKANSWQITGSIDKKDTKRLTAIKGPDRLNVTITTAPFTKETVVGLFNIHIGFYSELNKTLTE